MTYMTRQSSIKQRSTTSVESHRHSSAKKVNNMFDNKSRMSQRSNLTKERKRDDRSLNRLTKEAVYELNNQSRTAMRARHSSLVAMSKGMGMERRSSVGANLEDRFPDLGEQRIAMKGRLSDM